MVTTENTSSTNRNEVVTPHSEPEVGSKLEALRSRWASEEPTREFSIVGPHGELVYVGRSPEGVVLRLKDDKGEHIVFLTTAMASELGAELTQKR